MVTKTRGMDKITYRRGVTGEDSPGKIEAGGEQATEGEVSGHGGR